MNLKSSTAMLLIGSLSLLISPKVHSQLTPAQQRQLEKAQAKYEAAGAPGARKVKELQKQANLMDSQLTTNKNDLSTIQKSFTTSKIDDPQMKQHLNDLLQKQKQQTETINNLQQQLKTIDEQKLTSEQVIQQRDQEITKLEKQMQVQNQKLQQADAQIKRLNQLVLDEQKKQQKKSPTTQKSIDRSKSTSSISRANSPKKVPSRAGSPVKSIKPATQTVQKPATQTVQKPATQTVQKPAAKDPKVELVQNIKNLRILLAGTKNDVNIKLSGAMEDYEDADNFEVLGLDPLVKTLNNCLAADLNPTEEIKRSAEACLSNIKQITKK